jgi:hypothetical protein
MKAIHDELNSVEASRGEIGISHPSSGVLAAIGSVDLRRGQKKLTARMPIS